MAFVPLPVSATVLKDTTSLTARGYFTSVDKMRPKGNAPDKRVMESFGGWAKALAEGTAVNGKARGSFSYRDGSGIITHGIGTHLQVYGWQDVILQDITPFVSYENTKSNIMTSTSGSRVIRFDWASHGFTPDDRLQFRAATSIGGITISAGTNFTVFAISGNSFQVSAATSATSTVVSGGGTLQLGVYYPGGNEFSVTGPGWGVGYWGSGTWGGTTTGVSYAATTYTFDKWGVKNLLAMPSGGGLFEWQSIFSTPSELNTGVWTSLGTGWVSTGTQSLTATSGTASNAIKTITLVEGAFHRIDLDCIVSAGNFTPLIGSVSLASAISASGHYTYEFYKQTGDLTIAKSSTFSGTITNISVKQMDRMTYLSMAPTQNNVMCVTAENAVMIGGTIDIATGLYNPTLLRWSAFLGNPNLTAPANQVWTPASTNEAGDAQLNGGKIVAIKQGHGEVLIWTDVSIWHAVFTPDPLTIYSVTKIADGCGAMSSRSVATLGGIWYWVTPQGQLMAYGGGQPQIVPLTVLDDMYDNIAFIQQELVHMTPTAGENECQIHYPDKRDQTNECSRYIGFTNLGESFNGTFTRTTRHDSGITQYPWAVSSDGVIYWHELGQSADNAAIGETFSTGLIAMGQGDTLLQIDRFLVDFANFVGGFSMTVKSYMWPNDQSPVVFGPFLISPTSTKIDLGFIVGRYVSFHGTSTAVPSHLRFGSPMVNITDTGMVL